MEESKGNIKEINNLEIKNINNEDSYLINLKFTESEELKIQEFSKKIDINNSMKLVEYGASAQNKIASFSDNVLSLVKDIYLDEIGELLNNILEEIKSFQIEEKSYGILDIFFKKVKKSNNIISNFDKIEKNIEKLRASLEENQIKLLKGIILFENMSKLNEEYYKELSMYIKSGTIRIKEAIEKELPTLEREALESQGGLNQEKVDNFKNMIDIFNKKIYDLEITRNISLQMSSEIKMIQNSMTLMSEKIQSTITNTIPLWKSQMIIYLGSEKNIQLLKNQEKIENISDEILKSNIDSLKRASKEVKKSSNSGDENIEIINLINNKLFESIKEVINIQVDNKLNRDKLSDDIKDAKSKIKGN